MILREILDSVVYPTIGMLVLIFLAVGHELKLGLGDQQRSQAEEAEVVRSARPSSLKAISRLPPPPPR